MTWVKLLIIWRSFFAQDAIQTWEINKHVSQYVFLSRYRSEVEGLDPLEDTLEAALSLRRFNYPRIPKSSLYETSIAFVADNRVR